MVTEDFCWRFLSVDVVEFSIVIKSATTTDIVYSRQETPMLIVGWTRDRSSSQSMRWRCCCLIIVVIPLTAATAITFIGPITHRCFLHCNAALLFQFSFVVIFFFWISSSLFIQVDLLHVWKFMSMSPQKDDIDCSIGLFYCRLWLARLITLNVYCFAPSSTQQQIRRPQNHMRNTE